MPDIFLTNTLTRKKEKFVPIDPKEVRIYTCGPTVYRDVHIGNLRSYLMADILKRVFIYSGYKVRHVKNITDVGHMRISEEHYNAQIDPVIAEALKQGKTPKEIAEGYTQKFLEDEKKLNILPADVFPKATEHVSEMIELTKELIEKGFAYAARSTHSNDSVQASSGQAGETVYFDVKKFKDYGKLSGNTLDKMDKLLEAVRVSTESDKKDSVDFALWKPAETDRSMKWDSPWGQGFPGWHIECSAMALKLLGRAFDPFDKLRVDSARIRTIDVHTGGEDNIFPHHENEIAQSESATGKTFVNVWLHGGWLLIDNKKMARREGEVFTVSEIEKKGFDPLSFRYLALTAHYRSRLNFSWNSLEQAEKTLKNLYREISGYSLESEAKIGCAEYEQNFLDAVNDDLETPKALEVVWDLIDSDYPASAKLKSLLKFDAVLGLDFAKVAKSSEKVPSDIKELLNSREKARKSGDFKKSDEIREEIKSKGYEVVDMEKRQKLKKIIN